VHTTLVRCTVKGPQTGGAHRRADATPEHRLDRTVGPIATEHGAAGGYAVNGFACGGLTDASAEDAWP